MSKVKQKAQVKADRKKAEKIVKATLITELTAVVSKFSEPSKKLKKLIEKTASAFAKEINKKLDAPKNTEAAKTETAEPVAAVAAKKPVKPRAVKAS